MADNKVTRVFAPADLAIPRIPIPEPKGEMRDVPEGIPPSQAGLSILFAGLADALSQKQNFLELALGEMNRQRQEKEAALQHNVDLRNRLLQQKFGAQFEAGKAEAQMGFEAGQAERQRQFQREEGAKERASAREIAQIREGGGTPDTDAALWKTLTPVDQQRVRTASENMARFSEQLATVASGDQPIGRPLVITDSEGNKVVEIPSEPEDVERWIDSQIATVGPLGEKFLKGIEAELRRQVAKIRERRDAEMRAQDAMRAMQEAHEAQLQRNQSMLQQMSTNPERARAKRAEILQRGIDIGGLP